MPQMSDTLIKLLKGNKEYSISENRDIIPHGKMGSDIAQEVQRPEVIILSCSDSRAPVEYIFSARIGEIFCVRTAGHIVDDGVLASIEYGIYHLNIRTVLVMGHSNCGAVAAATQKIINKQEASHVPTIVSQVKSRLNGVTDRRLAERINVLETVNELYEKLDLEKLAKDEKVDIRAGFYDMATGIVDIH